MDNYITGKLGTNSIGPNIEPEIADLSNIAFDHLIVG